MIHWSPATVPPTSRWIVGSATLTIVTSSWITKNPRQTATRASFAARSGPVVPAAPVRPRVRAVVAGTGITPSGLAWVPVERGPSPTLLTSRYTVRRRDRPPRSRAWSGFTVTLPGGSDKDGSDRT